MKKLLSIFFVFFNLIISGCNNNAREEPDFEDVQVNFDVYRLDQKLLKCNKKEEINDLLKKYPDISKSFFQVNKYRRQEMLADELYRIVKHPSFSDTVKSSIDDVFGDLSEIKKHFTTAFKGIKYYYPDFKPQDVYTMVSGMSSGPGKDLAIQKDHIAIGLDYFLGKNCKYRPKIPDYILRRYKKDYIVPLCVMRIAQTFNNTNKVNKSLLAQMVDFGKIYYFKDRVLPYAHDTLITGYSLKDLKAVRKNEHIIWGHFIENQLLYETRHSVTRSFIKERPKTTEIGNKCPGRVGRWIGWQIVKTYMKKHPEKNLVDLMKIKDARKIFNESKYKPKIPG